MIDHEENTVTFENFLNVKSYKNSPSLRLHSKVIAKDKNTYVLDFAKSSGPQSTLATSLSSNDIQLHSLEDLKCISTLAGHTKTITGIKFDIQEQSRLFSSSLDGSICIWDTRQRDIPVVTLMDDSDAVLKYFNSFDVNNNGWLVCAGTELVREDSFLIFWDIRKPKICGAYWDSHTDHVTQVKFHPKKHTVMSSGAMDGLINIFDLSKECEDDALQHTLNTGSSVGKLHWCTLNSKEMISCITDVEEHQLWCIEEGKPSSLFDKDICQKAQMAKGGIDYVIDTFESGNNLYLATGTNNGDLQIWRIDEENFCLCTELNGGHAGIIRTVLWDYQNELLITGCEDGLICCWKSNAESIPLKSKSSKKLKITSHFKKPY